MGCHATTTFIQVALKEIPWPFSSPFFCSFPGWIPSPQGGYPAPDGCAAAAISCSEREKGRSRGRRGGREGGRLQHRGQHLDDSGAQPSFAQAVLLLLFMGAPSDEADSTFQAWLQANELHAPKDFKFAFTSAQSAANACRVAPATAANAWASIPLDEVDVASSWTIWMQGRRATPPFPGKPVTAAPQARIWRGIRTLRARADKGPAHDRALRSNVAKDVLHLALSWKNRGRLAREWGALHPDRRDAWIHIQTARIAVTDAATMRSTLRTWKHWCAWCQAQGEDPLDPSGAAPTLFLYAPTCAGRALHVPKSAPMTRFNHLRWLETCAGSPVHLAASDRPARQAVREGLPPEQRAASDPEVHVRLDVLFPSLEESNPTRIVVAIIQVLWMSVLRFQHLQRSVPVKLTTYFLYSVCWKGKGKPGYRWACPRYGPTGADVGKCVWDSWAQLAKGAGAPPFGLLFDNGVPLSLSQFHAASRSVLANTVQMRDASAFSSYSLRRSMPTLAEMSGAHPDDADALGDWTSSRSCRMRTRYADSREDRAAIAKLTQCLLVRRMAESHAALSWDVCRLLLRSVDAAAVATQANYMLAHDAVVQETPEQFLGGLAARKRKFDIAALPPRLVPSASGPDTQPPAAEPPSKLLRTDSHNNLPLAQAGFGRRWVMVKHRGAPHVHLLPGSGDVPLCRRRRGSSGKPISRMQAQGVGLSDLAKIGWNGPDVVCTACFAALPGDEKAATRPP